MHHSTPPPPDQSPLLAEAGADNSVSGLDAVYYLQALDDLAKAGVLTIEMRGQYMGDENLGISRKLPEQSAKIAILEFGANPSLHKDANIKPLTIATHVADKSSIGQRVCPANVIRGSLAVSHPQTRTSPPCGESIHG